MTSIRSKLRAVGLVVVGFLSRAKALRIPIAILHRMVFCRDQPFYRFHTVRKYEDAFREALRRYREQHPGKLTLVDVGGRSGINCAKLIKPGGLIMVSTVFAYHQHMSPSDYFRYTDEGLKYLFAKYGFVTDESGYDVSRRRLMKTGGRVPQSAPLIDWMGGWLERWFVYYIGRMPVEK